jgi:hypothetical protein
MLQVLHDVVTAACSALAVIVIGAAWPDRRKTVGCRGVVTMARRTSCAYINCAYEVRENAFRNFRGDDNGEVEKYPS